MPRSAFLRASASALLALVIGGCVGPTARADQSVHGDDATDTYVGTGGLILPPEVDAGLRHEVAACRGCAWRVTTPCAATTLGTPLDDTCGSVVRGCPGGRLLRTWFQPEGGAWRETGLICVGETVPWTVAEAERASREQLARAVPAPSLRTSPSRGVLPHLPTYFASGMAAGVQVFDMTVGGHHLVVHAQPSWTWSFGDGSTMRTADPGGAYPHATVTHAYRVAGRYRVTCSATWNAEFWSDGVGPFPVSESIRTDASLALEVGEGRAVLIPGAGDVAGRGTMADRLARPS